MPIYVVVVGLSKTIMSNVPIIIARSATYLVNTIFPFMPRHKDFEIYSIFSLFGQVPMG
jgi:hypothetical protein